jgi:hypothetical protein
MNPQTPASGLPWLNQKHLQHYTMSRRIDHEALNRKKLGESMHGPSKFALSRKELTPEQRKARDDKEDEAIVKNLCRAYANESPEQIIRRFWEHKRKLRRLRGE